jgi:hypothetical protein
MDELVIQSKRGIMTNAREEDSKGLPWLGIGVEVAAMVPLGLEDGDIDGEENVGDIDDEEDVGGIDDDAGDIPPKGKRDTELP